MTTKNRYFVTYRNDEQGPTSTCIAVAECKADVYDHFEDREIISIVSEDVAPSWMGEGKAYSVVECEPAKHERVAAVAHTVYENAEGKRVWVYWMSSRPEFVPGYWDLDKDGIENKPAQEWCRNMNWWVRAMQELGCSYENLESTIRRTMADALGFSIVRDYDPRYAA
jgi:hypothetical protein